MRKNAEALKEELGQRNQCDGPQFYIARDPRVTRVGAFLRKHHIDEWPRREARLSVPAGITGLWQVSRTRCLGRDFREWIEFDVQYVQQRGWRMDLYILLRTLEIIVVPKRLRRLFASSAGLSPPPTPAALESA
jgi:lipopolysaccharide/colanic/teichoic acid biosynthesis glycosyltransferase